MWRELVMLIPKCLVRNPDGLLRNFSTRRGVPRRGLHPMRACQLSAALPAFEAWGMSVVIVVLPAATGYFRMAHPSLRPVGSDLCLGACGLRVTHRGRLREPYWDVSSAWSPVLLVTLVGRVLLYVALPALLGKIALPVRALRISDSNFGLRAGTLRAPVCRWDGGKFRHLKLHYFHGNASAEI